MAYISFQPTDFFNPLLYTGNTSTNAITGVGFQPDMCWFKDRDSVYNHVLQDSVRGATKTIYPDDPAAEDTYANGQTSFDADGFTLGNQATVFNKSGDDYVSWNWKAGTTSGIAGSPSITPASYSFNATSGFSIIKYVGNGVAGATLPHGLGTSDIGLILVKNLDISSNWAVFQGSPKMGATKFMYLDENQAAQAEISRWNNTAPTSTLFSVGTSGVVNTDTQNYMAYVFANVKGYSRFSNYVGSGNVDGPFCYTGFQPAFVMVKKENAADNWGMFNNKQIGFNGANYRLRANQSAVEYVSNEIDILSNGFKIRTTDSEYNTSGSDYITMAFAEFPIVSSNDIPATAR